MKDKNICIRNEVTVGLFTQQVFVDMIFLKTEKQYIRLNHKVV